jgi:hypothetical protein
MRVHPALQDLVVTSPEIRVSGNRLLVVTPEGDTQAHLLGFNAHRTHLEVGSWACRDLRLFEFPFVEKTGIERRDSYALYFSLQVYGQLRSYSNALMNGLRGNKPQPAVRFYGQKIRISSITAEAVELSSSRHPAPLLFEREVVRECFTEGKIFSLDPQLALFCEIIWNGLESQGEQALLPFL